MYHVESVPAEYAAEETTTVRGGQMFGDNPGKQLTE